MLEGMQGVSTFQEYIYLSRYSRFLHDEGRREVWNETITRYFDFFQVHLKEKCDYNIPKELRKELESAVRNMEVMPSMRCFQTAGEALKRDNIAGYNCSYLTIDNPKSFSEVLYILMQGTGVGFSVERQYTNKLPEVPETLYPSDTTIIVNDSKLGWAKAFNELISLLYTGIVPKWDMSKVRPAGSILKTFGGRASGPEPLDRLFRFAVSLFESRRAEKLTSFDCHCLVCMVAECIVVGGVRRSALISLSNLSDNRMRAAKSGQWWTIQPYLSISNNSAVYTDRSPGMATFFEEWKSIYDSKSGERGIFSRWAAKNSIGRLNEFRKEHFGDNVRLRDAEFEWGCNPCAEIILRDKQFCNLSEVIVRSHDTADSLKKKARIAAILGTFQSTLTDFKYIGKKWKDNTEDERLLGVSLTGIFDNQLTNGRLGKDLLKAALIEAKKEVIATNIRYAKKLGIPESTAVTAVKPSGTVSALTDTSSGIHARHAPFYIRTVRSDKKDPVAQLMIDQGVYYEDDKMQPDHNWVFSFPMKSPQGAIYRNEINAISQLEMWKLYQFHWTEHKPSVTISVKDDEWLKVGAWVYDNFDSMSGVSFLPYSDHVYDQAPFQEITEDKYREWTDTQPQSIDWSRLGDYEKSDQTTGSQILACVAGGCEL